MLALTGYETALLVVAIAFIVFALVAALVIPRSRPTFPGNRLGLFLAICGVFFVAQMTAVLVLAEVGEADEPAHEEAAGGEEPPPDEPPPSQPAGDDAGGKEVFLGDAACGSCHTLADAGTTGAIGPNLDASMPPAELVVERVTNGMGVMPSFADTLSEEQIQDVAAYVSTAAGS
ncbi:MAG TPA: cytochrome c [Gaiellaceae bacterium]|nr:cytochrome c [Gaiellaceae bacterium]